MPRVAAVSDADLTGGCIWHGMLMECHVAATSCCIFAMLPQALWSKDEREELRGQSGRQDCRNWRDRIA